MDSSGFGLGCYPGVFPGVYPGVSGPSPGLSGFSGPLRDCPLRASPGLSGAAEEDKPLLPNVSREWVMFLVSMEVIE